MRAMQREPGDPEGDHFLSFVIGHFPEAKTCGLARMREILAAVFSQLSSSDEVKRFLDVVEPPPWVDELSCQRGQRVYLRNSLAAHLALLYSSLIGGFSAPSVTKVLEQTQYLTQSDGDAVWRRLLETFDMVLACLEDDASLQPGQNGWLSVIAVRMLHSRVRRRILSSNSRWVSDGNDPPINQQHLAVTLLSFSINVIDVINNLGGQLSRQNQLDFLMLWKCIGFLLGVGNLDMMDSPEAAKGAMEAFVLDLLHPTASSREIAHNILKAVADRPPLNWSFSFHSALARSLLGDPLADALALAKSSLLTKCFVAALYFFIFLLVMVTPFTESVVSAKRRVLRAVLTKQLATVAVGRNKGDGKCPFSGTNPAAGQESKR